MKTLVTFGEINLCKSIHQPCGISSRANSNPTSSWYLGMGIVFNFKTFKVLGSFRDSTRTWDVCRNSNFHWCMLDKFGVTLCPNFSTKILSAITYVTCVLCISYNFNNNSNIFLRISFYSSVDFHDLKNLNSCKAFLTFVGNKHTNKQINKTNLKVSVNKKQELRRKSPKTLSFSEHFVKKYENHKTI